MALLHKKRISHVIITVLLTISIVITIASFVRVHNKKQECIENTLNDVEKRMKKAVEDIESKLNILKIIGDEFAREISEKQFTQEELEKKLKAKGSQYSSIFGISIAYKPFEFEKNIRLYAPYYRKNKENVFELVNIGDIYDYADGSHDWFELSFKHGPVWQEPMYGFASDAFLAEYTVPVFKNNTAVAVVSVNYSLANIKDYMALLDVGESGYFCVISKKGAFIYHPNSELVVSQKNIIDFAREKDHVILANAASDAIKGGSGTIDNYTSPISGKGWLMYRPIPLTGWSLLTVVDKNDTQLTQETIRKQRIDLSFYLLITCNLFFILVIKRNWLRILCSSLSIIIGIGAVWFIVLNSHSRNFDIISNELALKKKTVYYQSLFKQKYLKPPVFIPTGLFIQSIEFTGANNVEITGYIWQKYKNDYTVQRGFIFPEATNVVSDYAYTRSYKDHEVVGWYFQATIRERFDYSKFPLDRDDLWIRIWPKDISKNIILVPDLSSYDFLNPESRPGIEDGCMTQGFDIAKSYFNYRTNTYNTDFGLGRDFCLKNTPELYYNIFLKRKFLDAFISHLIPLIVVICLLYFILLMNIREKGHALNVLAACSGLFFVVIFDHIGLRKSLSVAGIVYLEYFYFILYFVILAVSVNSYVYAFHKNLKGLQYRDNIHAKSLFWPVVMVMLYLVTIFIYY